MPAKTDNKKPQTDYSAAAAAWVNNLVPGKFGEAEKIISKTCTYNFRDQALRGPAIIKAFIESHEKALLELDSVEYLPGIVTAFGSSGALVAVADKLSLNGNTHVYNDRLLVRMEKSADVWQVVEVSHLPIQEEREKLKAFRASAGPKRS